VRIILSVNISVIFLGAGASVPLGLPTMVDLSERFEETISSDVRLVQHLLKAKGAIRRNRFSYDVESLYTYLLGCSDPCASLEKAGPYAASKCRTQPISKIRRSGISEKIRERLEEHLIKNCYLGQEYEKRRITNMFNRFFAKISGVNDWEHSEPDWNGKIFEVFTTNYDNAIELYGSEVGQMPFTGYTKTQNGKVRFVPEQYDSTPAKIKLYKIHGSVELSLLEDDSIIAAEPPKSPGEKHEGKSIIGKVMVYGPNKSLIAEPYFELLAHLKKRLTDAHECFVVGYSFRDPWINQIFRDVVNHRRQRTRWIEFISPSARYTISSRLHEIVANVQPINRSFQQYLNLPEEE